MHPQLAPFLIPFFHSNPKIVSLLKSFAKRQNKTDLPKVSKALLKKIEKYKEDLRQFGLPPYLCVAKVNEFIQSGIFLRADAKPIKKGTFIGIYSGDLEIVFATETKDNHYAYDVATSIKIHKEHLPLVRSRGQKPTVKDDYSIQVNAEKSGNFTRFINHSSIDTNIDAFAKRMPDDTVVICLITRKTIRPGEQLLSNYGGMYWAVLPIIPEPTHAKTYMVNTEGSVEKREEDLLSLTTAQNDLLLTLRKPLEADIDDLPPHFRSFLRKAKIRSLPLTLQDKIDSFEDQTLERGLPLHLTIARDDQNLLWQVRLKKTAKKIRNGSFVAALGGTWTTSVHKDKTKFDTGIEYKGEHLMLEVEQDGNFTRLLKTALEGNVSAILYRKTEDGSLYVILKALRDILPGELITIHADK